MISVGVPTRSCYHDDVSMRVRELDLTRYQFKAVQHVFHETAEALLEHHTAQMYKVSSTVLRTSQPRISSLRLTLASRAAWKEKNAHFRTLVEDYVLKPLEESIYDSQKLMRYVQNTFKLEISYTRRPASQSNADETNAFSIYSSFTSYFCSLRQITNHPFDGPEITLPQASLDLPTLYILYAISKDSG
jgi:hypothetical protein